MRVVWRIGAQADFLCDTREERLAGLLSDRELVKPRRDEGNRSNTKDHESEKIDCAARVPMEKDGHSSYGEGAVHASHLRECPACPLGRNRELDGDQKLVRSPRCRKGSNKELTRSDYALTGGATEDEGRFH